MADVFEVDIDLIHDGWEMGNPDQWDSGNHVRLILALEEELGVSFEVAEIESATTYKTLLATLETKL
jgi:acyl carrier protein